MNSFTQHTQQQGVTYIEHLSFAMGIGCRLLSSVFAFFIHALLPFIDIDVSLDLEATAGFLLERNHWIENAKANSKENRYVRGSKPINKFERLLH